MCGCQVSDYGKREGRGEVRFLGIVPLPKVVCNNCSSGITRAYRTPPPHPGPGEPFRVVPEERDIPAGTTASFTITFRPVSVSQYPVVEREGEEGNWGNGMAH